MPSDWTLHIPTPNEDTFAAAVGWIGWAFRPWPDEEANPVSWMRAQSGRVASRVLVMMEPTRPAAAEVELQPWLSEEGALGWASGPAPVLFGWLLAGIGRTPYLAMVEAGHEGITVTVHPSVGPLAREAFQDLIALGQALSLGFTSVGAWPHRPDDPIRAGRSALDQRAFDLAAWRKLGGVLTPADKALARWIGAQLMTLGKDLPPGPRGIGEALLDAHYAAADGEPGMCSLRTGRLRR